MYASQGNLNDRAATMPTTVVATPSTLTPIPSSGTTPYILNARAASLPTAEVGATSPTLTALPYFGAPVTTVPTVAYGSTLPTVPTVAYGSTLPRDIETQPVYVSRTTEPTVAYIGSYGSMPTKTLEYGVAYPVQYESSTSLFKRCLCELFGTFVFFLVVMLCSNALYVAAFYVGLIYAFWFISGAHFNPAITFAVVLARKMPLCTSISYIIAQIAGGALGGVVYKCIQAGNSGASLLGVSVSLASTPTHAHAYTLQVLYTTMLTFVALNVMGTRKPGNGQSFGIALGFVIVAGGFAADKLSAFLYFNPALVFGFMASGTLGVSVAVAFLFILSEMGGAILGFLLFKICRYKDRRVDHDFFFASEAERDVTYVEIGEPTPFSVCVFSEFLGTFWFVITIILNTALSTGWASWSGAAVLVSMIYALGDVSGSHFNPAVTLAVLVGGPGRLSSTGGVCYVIAQLVSAIPAGMIAKMIAPETGLFALTSAYGWFPIGFAEFLFTLILAYVALAVMGSDTSMWPNSYCALAIGFVFLGASQASGHISGGYLNPALPLGFLVDTMDVTSMAAVSGWPVFIDDVMKFFAIIFKGIAYLSRVFYYWFPEAIGAVFAGFMFRQIQGTAMAAKTLNYGPTLPRVMETQPVYAPVTYIGSNGDIDTQPVYAPRTTEPTVAYIGSYGSMPTKTMEYGSAYPVQSGSSI